MLTVIGLGALVVVIVLVAMLIVRGNSPAGKGTSGANAESKGRVSTDSPETRATGQD